jgi:hypothetical protein
MNMFRLLGIGGLIAITIGVISKNRTHQNIYYIIGGLFLVTYSAYIGDMIYIILQVIFIIAAIYDLYTSHKFKSEKFQHSLEESLWITETRFSQTYMENILAKNFFEFGRSGKTYHRKDMFNGLTQEIQVKLPLQNFQVRQIDENTILTTYISEVFYDEIEVSNRSSIWIKTETGWKLRFHQGTAVHATHE